MKKGELVALLESVTVDELKSAIPLKEKLERLEKRKKTLEKELASVVRQIESLGWPTAEKPAAAARGKGTRRARRRRASQPSLSSLVVEILKEKTGPLGINEICSALLREKNYRTRAKDFKAQVRVSMYRNDKGLFQKAGPGLFKLAADAGPVKKTAKKVKSKAAKKAAKKSTKKKITKKKAAGKTTGSKKKKTGKKAAKAR